MINRKQLIKRHNPILTAVNIDSPLTIGNGEFAFTADITGMQTLYDEYEIFPLCTMSEWGWNMKPNAKGGNYTLNDVIMTTYDKCKYQYAVECQEGDEEVYNWLRHNPHRVNLARISLLWDGQKINSAEITNIRQELDLYTGILNSDFRLNGFDINVRSCCAKKADTLGFLITSDAPAGRLTVQISLPDSSPRKNASDWTNPKFYLTSELAIKASKTDSCHLSAEASSSNMSVDLPGCHLKQELANACHYIKFSGSEFAFSLTFSTAPIESNHYLKDIFTDSIASWEYFWTKGGIVDFSKCRDPRALELERRTILSQYLIAVQCTGNLPPQETGLSCNSWYGKFHLEMHIIHAGWLTLWGHAELLEKSFDWYFSILENARINAKRNNFKGSRWPKMVGPEGIDSPSRIATLLIWQQPHILYMLELTKAVNAESLSASEYTLTEVVNENKMAFMKKYWLLIRETADFMVDFLQFNEDTQRYDLAPPLIPAQEEHDPEAVLNPVFELCYWHYGLEIAINWAKELGEDYRRWEKIHGQLAIPPIINNHYPAHANCPDTFTEYNRDHPSMLYGYGFIPCALIDEEKMLNTADLVLKSWDKQTLWGWDFAFIAMTYTRLGFPEKAIEALLAKTAKNSYTISGNNYQHGRDDLPLYLPGNGSLLFALAMMLNGYGYTEGGRGFPQNGLWDGIEFEGIYGLPH